MKQEAIAFLDGKDAIVGYCDDQINASASNNLWSFHS